MGAGAPSGLLHGSGCFCRACLLSPNLLHSLVLSTPPTLYHIPHRPQTGGTAVLDIPCRPSSVLRDAPWPFPALRSPPPGPPIPGRDLTPSWSTALASSAIPRMTRFSVPTSTTTRCSTPVASIAMYNPSLSAHNRPRTGRLTRRSARRERSPTRDGRTVYRAPMALPRRRNRSSPQMVQYPVTPQAWMSATEDHHLLPCGSAFIRPALYSAGFNTHQDGYVLCHSFTSLTEY